jgi:hypothetical protein
VVEISTVANLMANGLEFNLYGEEQQQLKGETQSWRTKQTKAGIQRHVPLGIFQRKI